MITLHHLDQSRSLRIVWLMQELDLPYDLVCHSRGPDMHAPAELRTIHPLGHAPIAIDDGTMLFESGAILEYVANRHAQGRLTVPPHHQDYAAYLTWLHAAEGTCLPALGPIVRASFGGPAPDESQIHLNDAVLRLCDDALAQHPYFGGAAFTIADIIMHTYLALAARFDAVSFGPNLRLQTFLDRVQDRPGYRRAIEVAEPHEPPLTERILA